MQPLTDRSPAVQAVRSLARASRLLERTSTELNLAHYRVLSAVASGEERASRLATRLALGKPAVSAAVDALAQRGLLVRTEVAADQRAAALSLTSKGAALLDKVEAAMVAQLNELCAKTPDAARVLESLTWLGPAIDKTHTERLAEGGQRDGAG